MRYGVRVAVVVLCLSMLFPVMVQAAKPESVNDIPPPPSAEQLKAVKKNAKPRESVVPMPVNIRRDAMRESALSYGARGGLAWRTYNIRLEMETRATSLDKVYDFRQLLIAAPSGLLIEPPIIDESVKAMVIEQGGQNAAVSDRILNINKNARIVSTARTWRAYLERQWGEVTPPPEILLPIKGDEYADWEAWFDEGWDAGIEQADEIFQADLDQLTADYQGMIRYRSLLTQGMVSPPYAMQIDRGVTGGGNEMRIGDRAVTITELPSLKSETQQWSPANQ